jgi:hypothetical protein
MVLLPGQYAAMQHAWLRRGATRFQGAREIRIFEAEKRIGARCIFRAGVTGVRDK